MDEALQMLQTRLELRRAELGTAMARRDAHQENLESAIHEMGLLAESVNGLEAARLALAEASQAGR